MLLTQDQFDELRTNGKLRLALIGMSSIGKSHRARELERELGFTRVSVDDEIAKRIADELPEVSIEGVASWLDKPYSPNFAEREKRYLKLEEAVCAEIATTDQEKNFILDTTGSAIYLSQSTLEQIKNANLVIHLAASPEKMQIMIERFLTTPKPVVWSEIFQIQTGETPEAAIERCYPELLKWRYTEYERLADITIPCWNGKAEQHSAEEFLKMIREQLLAA
jgi:shikimate kinase